MKADILWSEGPAADVYFVTSPANRFYMTGFKSSFGYYAATRKERIFVTDDRYSEAAGLALATRGYEFIFGTPKNVLPKLIERFKELGVRSIAIEDKTLTRFEYESYRSTFADFEIVPMGGAIDQLRLIKDNAEIECIKKAEDITSEAFGRVLSFIKPSVTELDIAVELEYQMRKLGAEGPSFDTIVASGVNTSKPHAVPTDKKIQPGDMILMDFGAKYAGYCADMTRTVLFGKQSELKPVYDIVLKAQEYALSNIKAGISCREADSFAREFLVANGYGKEFCHSLGHGVGLEIHEGPAVSPSSDDVLEENMVISVEPGVYIPGKGGIRIEDLVVVKNGGLVNLTTADKSLIQL